MSGWLQVSGVSARIRVLALEECQYLCGRSVLPKYIVRQKCARMHYVEILPKGAPGIQIFRVRGDTGSIFTTGAQY